MLRPVAALWKREVLKFVRDRSRVIGAVAQPIGFWLLLGMGFRETFRLPGAPEGGPGYLAFLFPGILLLTVLFTAIFSTISIIEERRSGFLQAAVVAPVRRSALLAGTLSGGVSLALAETALFLLALPFLPVSPGWPGILLTLAMCGIGAIAFTAMGVAFAWRMATTRGFHGVMNVIMLPLWLLSGAVFPVDGAHPALRLLMQINPVTYLMHGTRGAVQDGAVAWPDLAVAGVFAAVLVAIAHRMIRNAPDPAP